MKKYKLMILFFTSILQAFSGVTILGELPVDIELEVFESPVIIENNYLVDGGNAPFWWEAYNASMNFKEYDRYSDWINHFSKNYIDQFSITEERFIESKAVPLQQLAIVPERSALYGVRFKFSDREVYVLKLIDQRVEEFSGSLSDYEGFSVTEIFEKIDGVWKNQTPESIGKLLYFPYNDIEATKKVMGSPVAVLDKATGVFIPKISDAAIEVRKKISP